MLSLIVEWYPEFQHLHKECIKIRQYRNQNAMIKILIHPKMEIYEFTGKVMQ